MEGLSPNITGYRLELENCGHVTLCSRWLITISSVAGDNAFHIFSASHSDARPTDSQQLRHSNHGLRVRPTDCPQLGTRLAAHSAVRRIKGWRVQIRIWNRMRIFGARGTKLHKIALAKVPAWVRQSGWLDKKFIIIHFPIIETFESPIW